MRYILKIFVAYLNANDFKDIQRKTNYVKVPQSSDVENIMLTAADNLKFVWYIEENYKNKDGDVRIHLTICLMKREPIFCI